MLLLFALSSFSFVENDAIALSFVHLKPIDSINNYKDNIAKSIKNLEPKNHLQVSLTESVALIANGQNHNENNQNVLIQTKHGIAQQVNLEEKISIIAAGPNQKIIFIVTKNSERITTLERISNLERLRFGAKNIIANDVLWIEQVIENKKVILVTGDDIAKFSKFFNTVNYGVKIFVHNAVDPKNPIVVFLLLGPLAGYILIRSEEVKFQFLRSKQIISFCFIVILLSSMIATPLSVSPSYWFSAYADNNSAQSNFTSSILPTNSTSSILPTNSTSSILPTNST